MFLIPDEVSARTSTALVDPRRSVAWSYIRLAEKTAEFGRWIANQCDGKTLSFSFCRNRAGSVLAYLGTIDSGHAVALLDDSLAPAFKSRLIELYEPEFIFSTEPGSDFGPMKSSYCAMSTPCDELCCWRRERASGSAIHPDLALLLSTSGSTGSPKFVRLTRANVESNARSIVQALRIDASQRPVTSLPIHYSYGLSVLNSHLVAGAAVVLTDEAVTLRPFWDIVGEQECTSFAGVPYSYEILRRLDIEAMNVPALRIMTQAGGKLNPTLVSLFHERIARRNGLFYVMYGQTEATARIAVLPPEDLPAFAASCGKAIPGGAIAIERPDGTRTTGPGVTGEIVYRGPNVMMGYATCRQELALGDAQGGELRTGDIGYLDAEGRLYITGRNKRDAKVFGLRLNMDEVEQMLRAHGPTAVLEDNDRLLIFCEYGNEQQHAELARELARELRLHSTAFEFRCIGRLPLTPNGKIDYQQLRSLI